jgi:hypothetical protein
MRLIGKIVALVAMMAAATPALAQAPAPAAADSVGAMKAATDVMVAIGTKDEAALKTLILPQALLLSQRRDAAGTVKTAIRTRDEWLAGLMNIKGTPAEQMTDPRLLIHHDLAHVWAPYTFDIDGKRSHCGMDSLGLARIDGQWRITSMTWTAEPQGCPK